MVNRNDANIARRVDRKSGTLAINSRHFASEEFSSRNRQIKEPLSTDELIISLANAYENKRARQVSEWERRQHFRQVAL